MEQNNDFNNSTFSVSCEGPSCVPVVYSIKDVWPPDYQEQLMRHYTINANTIIEVEEHFKDEGEDNIRKEGMKDTNKEVEEHFKVEGEDNIRKEGIKDTIIEVEEHFKDEVEEHIKEVVEEHFKDEGKDNIRNEGDEDEIENQRHNDDINREENYIENFVPALFNVAEDKTDPIDISAKVPETRISSQYLEPPVVSSSLVYLQSSNRRNSLLSSKHQTM